MDGSEVLNKYFVVCKRASDALVSNNKKFTSIRRKEEVEESNCMKGMVQTHFTPCKGAVDLPGKPIAAHPNELPGGVPVRIR